jgi:hypothetical protein
MRNRLLCASSLMMALAACTSGDNLSPNAGNPSSEMSSSPRKDFVQERFVDYARGPSTLAAPVATTEGDDFRLIRGGFSWFTGGTVEYRIAGTEAVSGGNTAILASAATVDGFITTRSFVNNNSTTQINPCTGSPNTVQWAAIDGPGGIVAVTGPCFILQTKEIVGFAMTIDQAEPWVIGSDATKLDVQNTVTHEFGHVAGLDHVRAPQDGCLTMFPFVDLGEIQKRTLGLGDKLGMQRLYGSTDVTAGTCGT